MSLRRDEAIERAGLLEVVHYEVDLDLTAEGAEYASRTRITFTARSDGETFLDLKPASLRAIRLDGAPLSPDLLADGRYPLRLTPGEHVLEVEASMAYRTDGEGLHRSIDPTDRRTYCYGMSFMSAAPSIFACFDQPDLKAPYTLRVSAPEHWTVLGNAAGMQVSPGRWEFEKSQPLATYFVTLVAGEYVGITAEHDGIPLGLWARQSLRAELERDADDILTITRRSFDALHGLFGIRYAFGKYDQVFVPEFNAGAMENPGCVTIRDQLLPAGRVPRSESVWRATLIAHEMAHQWFGNLTSPRWWDDLWLNEAFAEYLGNRVTADHTEFTEARANVAFSRKLWGLLADSRPSTHPVAGTGAEDADAALQDFDGISYAKGSTLLGQLAARFGDDVFLGGVRDHLERHRFGNATMADLFAAWEAAGARDLAPWADAWLRTPGIDRLEVDRSPGAVVRSGNVPARSHALAVARWTGDAWSVEPLLTSGDRTPLEVRDDPVLLDADGTGWADLAFDDTTAAVIADLLPRTTDPMLRTTIWTTMRNAVHQGRMLPEAALDLICAGVPSEEQDAVLAGLGSFCAADGDGTIKGKMEKLLPVLANPDRASQRVHGAFAQRFHSAPAGSSTRLAAFEAALSTSPSAPHLRSVLAGGVPDGIDLDERLRWRALKRLTVLGAVTDADLEDAAATSTSADSRLAHLWCRARMATPEAKAWAWTYFTGETAATNYEIEAVGLGMWDGRQPDLCAPYVPRFFAEVAATAKVRAGWLLGAATHAFYPVAALTQETIDLAAALLARDDLDPAIRRVVVDCDDEVRRRRVQKGTVGGLS